MVIKTFSYNYDLFKGISKLGPNSFALVSNWESVEANSKQSSNVVKSERNCRNNGLSLQMLLYKKTSLMYDYDRCFA